MYVKPQAELEVAVKAKQERYAPGQKAEIEIATKIGGKGGGKPDLAMAGGTDASKLAGALSSVQAWVAERV